VSLQSKLESGQFAISCEFGPLKGTDTTEIKENIEILKGKVDAANVTDQQSSVMRLGSLVTSALAVQGGLEPIYQMTCRDRNRIALQSDLLSAWVLGIKNVLALTGDLPALGDHPQAVGVYDLDSVSLLQTITTLNGGHDLSGNELQGSPAFFPGAVVKVDSNTEASTELQIIKMQKKIAAGAKFFQTQAVYSAESFKRFMDRVSKFNVPVMAGVIPLKNAGMARYMNANVAGVFVPDDIIQKMADAPKEERAATGIQIAADLIKEIKPLCQGVHIMAIGWEKRVPEIIKLAGL
jgi:methylenetetrahydrofolate reductase (NADPH)